MEGARDRKRERRMEGGKGEEWEEMNWGNNILEPVLVVVGSVVTVVKPHGGIVR